MPAWSKSYDFLKVHGIGDRTTIPNVVSLSWSIVLVHRSSRCLHRTVGVVLIWNFTTET